MKFYVNKAQVDSDMIIEMVENNGRKLNGTLRKRNTFVNEDGEWKVIGQYVNHEGSYLE